MRQRLLPQENVSKRNASPEPYARELHFNVRRRSVRPMGPKGQDKEIAALWDVTATFEDVGESVHQEAG